MSDTILHPPAERPIERALQQSFLGAVVVWLIFVALGMNGLDGLGSVFADTDDAMRLSQVRDFLAGQGWYDLRHHRLDPPTPVVMHWTRVVDLQVAALMLLFGTVLPFGLAEKLALYLWPTLLVLPLLMAAQSVACRLGNRYAGLAAAFLTATCLAMTWQYRPGRIDHHGLQMLLTLCMMAGVCRADRVGAMWAGIAASVALGVGIEAVPYIALAGVGYAMVWVAGQDRDGMLRAFGAALAGVSLLCAALLIEPGRWLVGACDMLSANFLALTVVGGGGMACAAHSRWIGGSVARRVVALGVVAVAAFGLFVLAEPACLRGPNHFDPRLWPIWQDHINETQSIFALARNDLAAALSYAAVPVAALVAWVLLMGDRDTRRSMPAWVLLGSFLLAFAVGCTQIRIMVYANMFAVPVIAAALARIAVASAAKGGSIPVVMLAGMMLTSGMTLLLMIHMLVPDKDEAGEKPAASMTPAEREPCMSLGNYAAFAGAPAGLVVGPIDIGPMILLATHHTILSAPYHRYERGILTADAIMRAPPAEAEALARQRGVAYVAYCTSSPNLRLYRKTAADGLAVRLSNGDVPAWLEALSGTGPIRTYRVRSAS